MALVAAVPLARAVAAHINALVITWHFTHRLVRCCVREDVKIDVKSEILVEDPPHTGRVREQHSSSIQDCVAHHLLEFKNRQVLEHKDRTRMREEEGGRGRTRERRRKQGISH